MKGFADSAILVFLVIAVVMAIFFPPIGWVEYRDIERRLTTTELNDSQEITSLLQDINSDYAVFTVHKVRGGIFLQGAKRAGWKCLAYDAEVFLGFTFVETFIFEKDDNLQNEKP